VRLTPELSCLPVSRWVNYLTSPSQSNFDFVRCEDPSQLASKVFNAFAMRPSPDSAFGLKPDELPNDSRLEAGYIRYIRILPTEGPNGGICSETCIRRSRPGDNSNHESSNLGGFFYSAISYSWGDPTPSHQIISDGHERLVATNLLHFLQHANTLRQAKKESTGSIRAWRERKEICERRQVDPEEDLRLSSQWNPTTSTDPKHSYEWIEYAKNQITQLQLLEHLEAWPENWLWIDALCINQSIARERTHQVGIMSEIFGKADLAVSWLGPAYDNSDHAMQAIRGYYYSSERDPELSQAIWSLCERQYWKSLWVFQEPRLAKQILLMCGGKTLLQDETMGLWTAIDRVHTGNDGRSDQWKQSAAKRMMTIRPESRDFSLWNVLKETRNLECMDLRDRAYAILSVATSGRENIEADYSLSATPLRLAQRILHNKYATFPPWTLDNISEDCEFLEDAFKMSRGALTQYRQTFHILLTSSRCIRSPWWCVILYQRILKLSSERHRRKLDH